jgi:hypothetical protein
MAINNTIKLKIHSKNIKDLKEKYPNIKVGEVIDGIWAAKKNAFYV